MTAFQHTNRLFSIASFNKELWIISEFFLYNEEEHFAVMLTPKKQIHKCQLVAPRDCSFHHSTIILSRGEKNLKNKG